MNTNTEFSVSEFNKLIETISRGQAKTARDIGRAILCAVYLSIHEKDAGAANALVKCLRKSTKATAIVDTLEAYGNLAYLQSGKNFAHFDAGKVWPTSKEGLDALRAKCADWESFRKEKPVEELDVMEKLESLISAVAKAQKSGRGVVHAELVSDIAKLVAKVHAA